MRHSDETSGGVSRGSAHEVSVCTKSKHASPYVCKLSGVSGRDSEGRGQLEERRGTNVWRRPRYPMQIFSLKEVPTGEKMELTIAVAPGFRYTSLSSFI